MYLLINSSLLRKKLISKILLDVWVARSYPPCQLVIFFIISVSYVGTQVVRLPSMSLVLKDLHSKIQIYIRYPKRLEDPLLKKSFFFRLNIRNTIEHIPEFWLEFKGRMLPHIWALIGWQNSALLKKVRALSNPRLLSKYLFFKNDWEKRERSKGSGFSLFPTLRDLNLKWQFCGTFFWC